MSNLTVNVFLVNLGSVVWANSKTRDDLWVGDNKFISIGQKIKKLNLIFGRIPEKKDLGFISGVITKKGIPASGHNVFCLDASFNIINKTKTLTDGSYRFDNLIIYSTYIIIAQDNWEFKYSPACADLRTPEAYL